MICDVVMFQIDGLSGTGKSTLCDELLRRGRRAIDADAMFGCYADPVTGMATDVEIRANWMWDPPKIRTFAGSCHGAPVYICGGAMNQNDFSDLFTKRFMLVVDDGTMRRRLLTRANNDFGKDPDDLAEQLSLNTHAEADARQIGSIVIDATQPIHDVANEIIRLTS